MCRFLYQRIQKYVCRRMNKIVNSLTYTCTLNTPVYVLNSYDAGCHKFCACTKFATYAHVWMISCEYARCTLAVRSAYVTHTQRICCYKSMHGCESHEILKRECGRYYKRPSTTSSVCGTYAEHTPNMLRTCQQRIPDVSTAYIDVLNINEFEKEIYPRSGIVSRSPFNIDFYINRS